MESAYVAIVISIITIILFITNKLPMGVSAILGSVAMGILIPEMKLSQVYSGFSAPGWSMVVGMLVVSDAMFSTGVADKIGKAIGRSPLARNERVFIITVAIICTIMSAFMSNNGSVAIWMPIIAAVAATSNGKIRSKMVIFVAGTSAVIGGGSTLIGSTSQLSANAVLQGFEGYEAGLSIFEMSKVMIPASIVQIIYWATIGYPILKWVLKPESPDFDKGNAYAVGNLEDLENSYDEVPAWKQNLALITMLVCILLFVLSGFAPFDQYFNIAIIGLLGAAVVIGTGVVDFQSAFVRLPWNVLITIGAISGLGTGLDVSGGGELIANTVINAFGGQNASITVLTVIIVVLTSVLTNFMQNNATAAMIAPIVIPMAIGLGISPIPWIALVAACSNLAIATSYGTAVNMQILPAGYTFMDFVKIGTPLLLLLIITVSLSALVVYF